MARGAGDAGDKGEQAGAEEEGEPSPACSQSGAIPWMGKGRRIGGETATPSIS